VASGAPLIGLQERMWQHKKEGLLEKFQEGLWGEEGWEE